MKLCLTQVTAKREHGSGMECRSESVVSVVSSEEEAIGAALKSIKAQCPPPTWKGYDVEVRDLTEIARTFVAKHG